MQFRRTFFSSRGTTEGIRFYKTDEIQPAFLAQAQTKRSDKCTNIENASAIREIAADEARFRFSPFTVQFEKAANHVLFGIGYRKFAISGLHSYHCEGPFALAAWGRRSPSMATPEPSGRRMPRLLKALQ